MHVLLYMFFLYDIFIIDYLIQQVMKEMPICFVNKRNIVTAVFIWALFINMV